MEKARQFYEALFGWKGIEPPVEAIHSGGVEGFPDESVRYVVVENADDIEARVAPLGGTLVHKVVDVPGVGRAGVLADPGGVALGFFQPVVKV